jgi:hypothetical protein
MVLVLLVVWELEWAVIKRMLDASTSVNAPLDDSIMLGFLLEDDIYYARCRRLSC